LGSRRIMERQLRRHVGCSFSHSFSADSRRHGGSPSAASRSEGSRCATIKSRQAALTCKSRIGQVFARPSRLRSATLHRWSGADLQLATVQKVCKRRAGHVKPLGVNQTTNDEANYDRKKITPRLREIKERMAGEDSGNALIQNHRSAGANKKTVASRGSRQSIRRYPRIHAARPR
jgi:hypothetical protein